MVEHTRTLDFKMAFAIVLGDGVQIRSADRIAWCCDKDIRNHETDRISALSE